MIDDARSLASIAKERRPDKLSSTWISGHGTQLKRKFALETRRDELPSSLSNNRGRAVLFVWV